MDMMQLEGLTKLMSREQDDEDGQGPSINYTPSTLSGGRAPGDDEPREELFATVLKTRKAHDPKAIWHDDEVTENMPRMDDDADTGDTRTRPDFEMFYKQKLSSEDVYLNMGFKDNSTTGCGEIVVEFLVRSSQYKLFLDLPETVDSDKGVAKFDVDKETLRVTLPIIERD